CSAILGNLPEVKTNDDSDRPGSLLVLDEDIPAAVTGDPERQLAGPPQGFSDSPMPPGRRDQQQEATSAGPQELAPSRAGSPRRLVPLVDPIVTDPAAKGSLQ